MLKIVAVATVAAFSVAALSIPAMAKDKPGQCGVMKYFDKKTKKCKSK